MITAIEKKIQREVEGIYGEILPALHQVLAHLETVGQFDIFNGEVILKTLPVHGEEKQVMIIENEQNIDFCIVFDVDRVDFYAFEHAKSSFESSYPGASVVLAEGINEKFIPALRCFAGKREKEIEVLAIYNYRQLYSLNTTLGSIFCELDIDPAKKKEFYELDDLVSRPVNKCLQTKRQHLIKLLSDTTDKIDFETFSIYPIVVKTSDIKTVKESHDMANALRLSIKAPTQIKTETELEAECYTKALVFDGGNEQVVVFEETNHNSAHFERHHFEVYYSTNEVDDRFGTFENLINNFKNYKNTKIFEYNYHLDKTSNHTHDQSRATSAIGYFKQLSLFMKMLEHTDVQN